ncbi:uncharacterized protein C8Q71DRAFT_783251 [Rhodofomes roseus]|uniref:Uncharacterized protein n=1 Tax=Rhodofomes roseus TaxID=34475 RepID=A0ABQ8K3K6_9APHY|nr:uncharacterized protein C8Q71DRAFT_783251 [Rhodofomes roseus]KAH9831212.1 hypothetical protein C8Q71DRAFT_783251 [Rhodofomes roseus]
MDKDTDKDAEMSIDSPLEIKPNFAAPPQVQLPEVRAEQRPAQPHLQPRPQPSHPQIQVPAQPQVSTHVPKSQPQTQMQSPVHMQPSSHFQGQPQAQSQPQSSQNHRAMRTPFDNQLSLGHNAGPISLLSVGYQHSLSHPTSPTPLSPHPSMSDALRNREHVSHGHSHQEHGQHDHSRHMGSTASSSSMGSHISNASAQPVAQVGAPPSSSINLRAPYTQMHHVPHPHAHARHHHSYVNNVERLYADDRNVMGISGSLKGDMQSRAGDLMRYGTGPESSRR